MRFQWVKTACNDRDGVERNIQRCVWLAADKPRSWPWIADKHPSAINLLTYTSHLSVYAQLTERCRIERSCSADWRDTRRTSQSQVCRCLQRSMQPKHIVQHIAVRPWRWSPLRDQLNETRHQPASSACPCFRVSVFGRTISV